MRCPNIFVPIKASFTSIVLNTKRQGRSNLLSTVLRTINQLNQPNNVFQNPSSFSSFVSTAVHKSKISKYPHNLKMQNVSGIFIEFVPAKNKNRYTRGL